MKLDTYENTVLFSKYSKIDTFYFEISTKINELSCMTGYLLLFLFFIVLLRTHTISVLLNLSFLLLDPRTCWNMKKHNAMF